MEQQGLYDPLFEHDACGVGFIVNINGEKTHQIVSDGVAIIKNLVHRGAVGGDQKTGDGAGILVQIPHAFFVRECERLSIKLANESEYGVGMLFLPRDGKLREHVINMVETLISDEGGELLGSREVPVNPDCLGDTARESMPVVWQVFIRFQGVSGKELERKLYVLRKCIENKAIESHLSLEDFSIPSFSSKTITYKGMFSAIQLESFYSDLSDKEFKSAIAVVHQRYSTNTFPSWPLAQPFRQIAHNGEINTLRGNINRMKAREATLASSLLGENIYKITPVIDERLSDSGILDNVLELLNKSGRSVEHSMMMMIPEAFGSKYHISEDKRSFYEYHAAIMEPWDGPAAIAFTDGIKVGACLDRNGLRPARYTVTKSGRFILSSEVGVLNIPPADVLKKGRLAPGRMVIVDTEKKRIIDNNEIKATVSRQKPYRRWLLENKIELQGLFQPPGPVVTTRKLLEIKHKLFGYTLEELKLILQPMAENGQEPVGSMGNDAALAVLSPRPQLFFNYFKQLFAQVTNPPIDPYRENLVMSLMSFIGRERNLLEETPLHCRQLKLLHPILTNEDIDKMRQINEKDLKSTVLPILFPAAADNDRENKHLLKQSLTELCRNAESKVDQGCSILILSDRGADETHIPIPTLLATSAVHHHLVSAGKRQLTGIIVETGEVRDVMQFATLIGYGASAINPYLAFETITDMKKNNDIAEELKLETVIDNYITAIKKGLLKIMSKMGISTIRSYMGAQVFEAIGLDSKLIADYFPGTPSRIEGISLDIVEQEARMRHDKAYNTVYHTDSYLESGGNIYYRRFSENHLITPEAVVLLQKATREGSYETYKQYAKVINDNTVNACTLRGLFGMKKTTPVPLDEVEPEEAIIKRFITSAMSFGSISKETHETLAKAMNSLGASSNSGEGGEDEERYKPLPDGSSLKSMIKQVASARFGVDITYLVNSKELQIKMAQGAKPGEGGQLPGHKVDRMIAKVRHSTPGVMLISPPPHHDIYSIEDLSQLIFDLKNANPDARISVKLVAEVGVGTVAAGVAKGKADTVLISGHDGGTGASPISSIKYAGIPWEIGLADTQQTLVLNNLRSRIRVQVDGKMKTGRDIIIAALLGGEEYGFGTIPLITLGCIMMRKCHLNTCPVGIATQDPRLRKKFSGKPEYVVNFMRFVARDVREQMAELGFRTIDEMVGRSDLLETNEALGHWKSGHLDFSKIFYRPAESAGASLRCTGRPEHDFSKSIDHELIKKSAEAINNKKKVNLFATIVNSNRTVGATLSAEIAKKHGSKGLPDDTVYCKFTGSAGQSFGAFLAPGITFELEGDANDYFGKGLSGGRLIVYPPKGSTYRPENNIITGNVNLFGATRGEVFINGMAGERFAVRNSGAVAVVEGVGDHGCEYMTGGTVVVLGKTGINFAAGMSGGIAYVLDEDQLFDTKCNLEMVDIEPVMDESEQTMLYNLIERHIKYTGSEYAGRIIRDWNEVAMQFVRVMPIDYRKALERMKREESKETELVSMTEEVFE
jgi:glutamate synthase (NADPH/NADH) large chain